MQEGSALQADPTTGIHENTRAACVRKGRPEERFGQQRTPNLIIPGERRQFTVCALLSPGRTKFDKSSGSRKIRRYRSTWRTQRRFLLRLTPLGLQAIRATQSARSAESEELHRFAVALDRTLVPIANRELHSRSPSPRNSS
jgi:hypothetical protein